MPELREKGYQYKAPVHIGRSCWLGAGLIIVHGINVGDNVVIDAGNIVTKDIPSMFWLPVIHVKFCAKSTSMTRSIILKTKRLIIVY